MADEDLMAIVRGTALNVSSVSEQLGILASGIRNIKADITDLKEDSADTKDRLRSLEEDQFVDLVRADAIRRAAQRRVASLLGIEWDERHNVRPECMHDYVHYYSRFCGRLHNDAKRVGLEGPRVYATPRKNYQALIDFINGWYPAAGVDGQKAYYDLMAARRRDRG